MRSNQPLPAVLTTARSVATFGTLFLLVFVLGPLNIGSFEIGDEVVTGPEFVRHTGALFAVFGGLSLAVAIGLWRERAWSRPLLVVVWPIAGLAVLAWRASHRYPVAGELVPQLVALALVTAGMAWCLYRKRDVVSYYEVAERRDATRQGAA